MSMTQRDATERDLPAIGTLFRDSFVATFGHLYAAKDLDSFLAGFTSEAWAQTFARPGTRFRVAEDEAGIAAYCQLNDVTLPIQTERPALEIGQLYALDRAKGTGTAQALMDWALTTARADGAEELWLSVYVDNHRARRFYARYGFEDMGPYTFMVGSHADEDRLMRAKL